MLGFLKDAFVWVFNLPVPAFHALLPAGAHLPDLSFEMPHLIYWAGLVLFPLAAMRLVRREERRGTIGRTAMPIAYIFWLSGGFAGLHRFYLRSWKPAVVFILLFVGVLYCSSNVRHALDGMSEARGALSGVKYEVKKQTKAAAKGAEGAAAKLAKANAALPAVRAGMASATGEHDKWRAGAAGYALIILILLLIDAILIPRLTRRCAERESHEPPLPEITVTERQRGPDPRREIRNPLFDAVGRVNGWVGEFIAYWSVIAVAVYFFEVIARYVFNSPTNWAHESMFLMFGMQYLLSGAFALREESHVRVDVVYELFSLRTRTMLDVGTSFFFFVFTLTLLITGAIFFWDSVGVWEVSFTEWGIQYWPVKLTISAGALLLLLQGAVRLAQDVMYLQQVK